MAILYLSSALSDETRVAGIDRQFTVEDLTREGVRLLRAAAEKDVAFALNELGDLYANGLFGLPVDFEQAFSYFVRADYLGDPIAGYGVGRAYWFGQGAPLNGQSAIVALERSASRGYEYAICALAFIFAEEEAFKDTARSHQYRVRAKLAGHPCLDWHRLRPFNDADGPFRELSDPASGPSQPDKARERIRF